MDQLQQKKAAFKLHLELDHDDIIRLLQMNLFVVRNLIELFKPPEPKPVNTAQGSFAVIGEISGTAVMPVHNVAQITGVSDYYGFLCK